MHTTRRLLCLFAALLTLQFSHPLTAADQTEDNLPSSPIGLVQDKLESLADDQTADGQKLKEIYQKTLKHLKARKEYQERVNELNQLITTYGSESEQLRVQIETYLQAPRPKVSQLDVDEALQRISVLSAQLLRLKNQQDNLNNQLTLINGRKLSIPDQIKSLKASQKQLISKVATAKLLDDELTQATRMLDNAHLEAVNEQINMLELELLSSGQQQSLIKLRSRLLENQIAELNRNMEVLQNHVAEQRRQQSDQAVAASKQLSDVQLSSHPLLRRESRTNEQLSQRLQEINGAIEKTLSDKTEAERQSRRVGNELERIKKQLQWLKESASFGQTLRAELSSLPDRPNMERLLERQATIQFESYDLEQQALRLDDFDRYVSDLVKQASPPLNSEDTQALVSLIRARSTLINNLLDSYRSLQTSLAQLEVAAQELGSLIRQFHELLARHLLWVPNTSAVSFSQLPMLHEKLSWLASAEPWRQLLQAAHQQSNRLWPFLLALGAAALVWRLGRKRIPYLEREFTPCIGNVSRDRFSYSLHLMFAGLFYALPFPLLMYQAGQWLASTEGLPVAQGIGEGLVWSSWLLFFCCCLSNWAGDRGLLVRHLQWQPRGVRKWKNRANRLFLFTLPMLMLIGISEAINTETFRSTLGRSAFILWCLGLSLFFWRTLQERLLPEQEDAGTQPQQRRPYRIIWILLCLLPLTLAGLSLFGYLYTGLKLISLTLYSVAIAFGLIVAYGLSIRALLMQARNLAFEQAKAKRAEILAQRAREEESQGEAAAEPPPPEDNYIDIKTISDQTRQLVRILFWVAFAVALWALWSPLFTALDILDSFTVWETRLSFNGTEQLQPITLKALLLSLCILLLMWLGLRNLPGVLQLLVLQHLDLPPGTGYAITTLLRYVLVFVGLVVSFNIIGFDWAKMQWLVAALGVGLGFGLQEIFANFISGLIILFEKPIRIGDTVTINGLSGTVSKIQIRATTIVDWDRKEIIVPNKSFITEQLVNWSLSDPITRVRVTVGVAYGSDNQLVERLLLEAAAENEQVLSNPKPEAYFIGFGDSSLTYELRVYVSDLSDRFPVTHQLHNLIDAKFRAHQVEIAFPQLDLHIKRDR